ncbi:MAG: hypothetical protein FIA96_12045 [Betaproteobacteria bacterium]|nr:hypothetical protein [Betaproteobacteria bacterium]
MSRSALPPETGVPEPGVSELHALYREAARAEPGPTLDKSILDAAQAELRSAGQSKARRQAPWWKGWLPAASALAIALAGLSLTWRVLDQQERDMRQEMKAAEAVRGPTPEAAHSAAPAQGAADASSLPRVPAAAEKRRPTESPAIKDAPPGVSEVAPIPPPAAPAPTAPAGADEALKKSRSDEKEAPRERRDASPATGATSSPARQAGKLEAGRLGAASGGEAAADALAGPSANRAEKSATLPPPDAATPEAWLQHIRELRAAGRSAEAAQSLARFRERYPDFALPQDLLNPK